jgi:LmbE family N-acetylglucosaminyl deacetylase
LNFVANREKMMQFKNKKAECYFPNNSDKETTTLPVVTHLAIGAHQDDVEVMAYHGILQCFHQEEKTFGAVIVTDGAGSPRTGIYAPYTDEAMCRIRAEEQKKAAQLGEYTFAAMLGHPSSTVKNSGNPDVVSDLVSILEATCPEVVYTHNLADKHDTHVAVTLRTLEAIRALPPEKRPRQVVGCEVWRNLDWLPDELKVVLDCSAHPNLHSALVGVFDSQIAGGKRYDLATMGRGCANATFYSSHEVDASTSLTFAMDLSPLVANPEEDPTALVLKYIDQFRDNVAARIRQFS